MKIRCPNCQSLAETEHDSALDSIHCEQCESIFSLFDQDNLETLEHQGRMTTKIGHFELVEQLGSGGCSNGWGTKNQPCSMEVGAIGSWNSVPVRREENPGSMLTFMLPLQNPGSLMKVKSISY